MKLCSLVSLNSGLRWVLSLGQERRLRCMAAALLLACLTAGGGSPAVAQVPGMYWQCQPIDSTHPVAGYCPVGQAYPAPVAPTAATVGGGSVFRSVALTSTAVAVKATAGTLSLVHVANQGGSAVNCYLNLYDVAAASVSVGSTTPTITLNIPAATTLSLPMSIPVQFSTAISAAAVTTPGGSTACNPILSATLLEYK